MKGYSDWGNFGEHVQCGIPWAVGDTQEHHRVGDIQEVDQVALPYLEEVHSAHLDRTEKDEVVVALDGNGGEEDHGKDHGEHPHSMGVVETALMLLGVLWLQGAYHVAQDMEPELKGKKGDSCHACTSVAERDERTGSCFFATVTVSFVAFYWTGLFCQTQKSLYPLFPLPVIEVRFLHGYHLLQPVRSPPSSNQVHRLLSHRQPALKAQHFRNSLIVAAWYQ